MSIAWDDTQGATVGASLAKYPMTSHRCADAAREILPVARQRDEAAAALLVEPLHPMARYVLPKHNPSPEWYHHVLVRLEDHGLDAMTGVPGHPYDTYLATYFVAPAAHRVSPVDLSRGDL